MHTQSAFVLWSCWSSPSNSLCFIEYFGQRFQPCTLSSSHIGSGTVALWRVQLKIVSHNWLRTAVSAVSSKYNHADHLSSLLTNRDRRLPQTSHFKKAASSRLRETCLQIALLSTQLETPSNVLSGHLFSRILANKSSDWPKAEGDALRTALFK